jgi:hypothetical protein
MGLFFEKRTTLRLADRRRRVDQSRKHRRIPNFTARGKALVINPLARRT